ncbi:MAG: TonB-dependent receptor [Halieaceae bacterium]|jgi:vitamin B12 transporter|nr:TonB-dependent receptor [Halieaceae bacterium]
MNKLFPLTALAIACASSPLASANNKLEEIIITSSRVEMPLRQVGTSVSVITAEEIQARGFNSLYEVLRSQPAVAVSNSGGSGKPTALRIRGEEGFRTLVLIDGIDISQTSTPQVGPNMEHLLSSGIQRVEILRGPQGLMYGADAGGVVSISSQSPRDGFGGELSAETGRYGAEQLAANLGGGNDMLDFNLSATTYETDGFNARTTDTELGDKDGYDNTTVHGRLGWNVSDTFRLQLVARNVQGENEYDSCYTVTTFSPTDVCSNDYDQEAWRVVANYTADRFTHQLSYTSSETDRQFYAEGAASFGARGELEHTSYLGSFKAGDNTRLIYGADLESESIDDGSFDTDRDQNGYYLEYQGGFSDHLFVTAGARYDDNDDFGSYTSYRVSGAYLFDTARGELKLKATYGTGFRAPSLYEITYNSSWAYPPASLVSLDAEESKGFDLGIAFTTQAGTYLEAVYFDQAISNEIYFDPLYWSGYLQDKGDTDSSGVELIVEFPLSEALSLNGNYTYNDTENTAGDNRIRRPEHLANIGVGWRPLDGALILGLNLRASHGAQDIDGSDLDDYEVVDLNASFDVLQGLQVYGRVENLFDETYQEIATYNTSARAAYVGLRYSF